MEIYLLRHGIAEDAPAGKKDADRALTADGRKKLRALLRRAQALLQAPELSDAARFFREPLHPYSQKLMASVPRERARELVSASQEVLAGLRGRIQAGDRVIVIGAAGGVPLVFFQRFRGTMDHWDPALLEVIATAGVKSGKPGTQFRHVA